MYVSPHDINSIKKYFRKKEFILTPNGVSIPDQNFLLDSKIKKDDNIIIGTISNWNKISICEFKWFIEDYFPKLKKSFPSLKLTIAGLDKNLEAIKYFGPLDCVSFIGEIDDLNEFFSNIDIFIAAVPKGVGILNKVLDAFAHQKLVLGLSACFHAFPNNNDGSINCQTFSDFKNGINLFLNSPTTIKKITKNSFNYVKKTNDWKKNYNILVKDILKFYNIDTKRINK